MTNKRFSPITIYSLGLLGVLLFFGIELTLGQSTLSAYQFFSLSQRGASLSLSPALSTVIGLLLSYILIYVTSIKYMLVSKYAIALAIPLYLTCFALLGIFGTITTWISSTLLILALYTLYGTYQDHNAYNSYTLLGLIIFALAVLNPVLILAFPLFLISGVILQSSSPRSTLALLIGAMVPVGLISTYLIVKCGLSNSWSLVIVHARSLANLPLNIEEFAKVPALLSLTALSLPAVFALNTGNGQESVRQRLQLRVLTLWLIYGTFIALLYRDIYTTPIMLLSASILGGRAIALCEGKVHKTSLIVLFLIFLAISILT